MMAKRLPKALSQDQWQALCEEPNIDSVTGLRDRVILEVMGRAGLRVSEVAALRRQDITWGSPGQPTVLHVLEGKGAKDRNVPVSARTAQWLRMWDEARHGWAKTFFHTTAGRSGGAIESTKHSELSRHTIYGMVKKYAGRAGLPDWVSPHNLRHTCACWLINQLGWPTARVQKLLGHERLQTTEIYLEVADPDLEAAMLQVSRDEADQQSLDEQPSAFAAAIAGVIDGLDEEQKRQIAEQLGLG